MKKIILNFFPLWKNSPYAVSSNIYLKHLLRIFIKSAKILLKYLTFLSLDKDSFIIIYMRYDSLSNDKNFNRFII